MLTLFSADLQRNVERGPTCPKLGLTPCPGYQSRYAGKGATARRDWVKRGDCPQPQPRAPSGVVDRFTAGSNSGRSGGRSVDGEACQGATFIQTDKPPLPR